ncbi:WD40-repeat-containing domain protein [Geranomyces variabilis]|nr:WD40-repeat-containing domain protein [Geranomyces variabilis]
MVGHLQASLVHPTSVNCLASTRNMRWVFSGGEDGFIRKFDFVATLNGEQTLTQTQKHGLADSVEKGGVLSSVWENEEFPITYTENPPSLAQDWSPVYSLDVHSEGVWCVSGCKSGNINLWSVRHDEGHCQHVLRYHKNTVSCLRITPGERGLISGSWDRSLVRWDLDVGKITTRFQGVRSQITVAALDPAHIPLFRSSTHYAADDSLLMATSYDGAILIYDQRTPNGAGRKFVAKQSEAPPWCLSACWSPNGDRVFCGRRNASIDEYDIREGRWARSLRLPRDSGPVTLVAALPNSRHLLCASQDILRLWDLDSSASDGDVVLPPTDNSAQDTFLASDAGSTSAGHSPAHAVGIENGEGYVEGEGTVVTLNGTSSLANGAHLRATPQSRVNRLRQEEGVHTTTPPLVPFTVVPGHTTGIVTTILMDTSARFLITASGTRGWEGAPSHLCLVNALTPVTLTNVPLPTAASQQGEEG